MATRVARMVARIAMVRERMEALAMSASGFGCSGREESAGGEDLLAGVGDEEIQETAGCGGVVASGDDGGGVGDGGAFPGIGGDGDLHAVAGFFCIGGVDDAGICLAAFHEEQHLS